jgi:hypothetical protein
MGDFGLKAGFMPDFPYLAMSGIVLSCWKNHVLLMEGSCCSVKKIIFSSWKGHAVSLERLCSSVERVMLPVGPGPGPGRYQSNRQYDPSSLEIPRSAVLTYSFRCKE